MLSSPIGLNSPQFSSSKPFHLRGSSPLHLEMTTTLGKRKRRADIKDPTSPEPTDAASTEHLQALVRKHFEAKYKPLPTLQIVQNAPVASNDLGASESEDSEWEGLDGTKGQAVPVIEHVARPNVGKDAVPKSELKTFMVPTPLTLLPFPSPSPVPKAPTLTFPPHRHPNPRSPPLPPNPPATPPPPNPQTPSPPQNPPSRPTTSPSTASSPNPTSSPPLPTPPSPHPLPAPTSRPSTPHPPSPRPATKHTSCASSRSARRPPSTCSRRCP